MLFGVSSLFGSRSRHAASCRKHLFTRWKTAASGASRE
jgi:hypothetical protein